MKRLRSGLSTASIEAAYSLIPPPIADRLRAVDWFLDTNPIWAGLHTYETTEDGRPYSETAHTVHPMHQCSLPRSLRAPTVVLFRDDLKYPDVAVHELGHILHEQLRFEPSPSPVSDYAGSNKWEAFACAFTAWVVPWQCSRRHDPTILWRDSATMRLFEHLAS